MEGSSFFTCGKDDDGAGVSDEEAFDREFMIE